MHGHVPALMACSVLAPVTAALVSGVAEPDWVHLGSPLPSVTRPLALYFCYDDVNPHRFLPNDVCNMIYEISSDFGLQSVCWCGDRYPAAGVIFQLSLWCPRDSRATDRLCVSADEEHGGSPVVRTSSRCLRAQKGTPLGVRGVRFGRAAAKPGCGVMGCSTELLEPYMCTLD